MQMMVRELNQQRVAFGAMMAQVGEGKARVAFARAMNHEGRKTTTLVKRTLAKQTSAAQSLISGQVKFLGTNSTKLVTVIRGKGGFIPLKEFHARQFSYGVRAKVWGRQQIFKHAFIVESLGGNVFKNTGQYNRRSGRKNAIVKLWGPAIPAEMVKDQTAEVFMLSTREVTDRALHELWNMMRPK